VAKFSVKDAEALDAYNARLEAIADILRDLVLQSPPNMTQGSLAEAIPQLLKSALLGKRISNLDTTGRRDLLAMFSQSAGDWLDGWFESDPIKAVLGFDGIVGAFASPYTPGTAYVLLHHVFGEVNGEKGAWGHAVGGMGAITQAMAAACREKGVEIRTGVSVAEVLTEKGRAVGVVTEAGETLRARRSCPTSIRNCCSSKLIDPALLPADFNERINRYRSGSGTFRMNVALSELPRFSLPARTR
jgi:phytoene dehydrogenase-like protein